VASQTPLYSQYSGPPGWSLLSNYPTLTLTMVEISSLPGFDPRPAGQQSNLNHRRSPHHINVHLLPLRLCSMPTWFFSSSLIIPQLSQARCGSLSCLVAIPGCFKDQLGMDKHVFLKFARKLFTMTSANHSQHVDLAEKVAIFL